MSRSSERAPREKVGFIACAVLGGVVGRFVAQWSLPLGVAVAVAIGGVVLARRALGAQGFSVRFATGRIRLATRPGRTGVLVAGELRERPLRRRFLRRGETALGEVGWVISSIRPLARG